jgi:hypothetical protein
MTTSASLNVTTATAMFFLGLSSPADAQTRDQCLGLARGLSQAITPMMDLDKAIEAINWDLVIPQLSGQFKAAAESAKQTQADFLLAARRYRIALEEITYLAQRCAR